MEGKRRGVLAATAISLIASLPLVLVPVVGPVAATWIGGRRAGNGAIVSALVVAVVWWALLTYGAGREVSIGGTTVSLGPITLLRPLVCAGLLAGGLLARGGRPAVTVGVVLLVAGGVWSGSDLEPVVGLVKQLSPAPKPAATDQASCPDHLKKLYTAAMLYADSWDGQLPPANRWEDALKETLADTKALRCPAVSDGGHGYAMNRELGGAAVSKVAKPGTTPLFFDTRLPGPNAAGTLDDVPRPGRHGGKSYAVYADGHTGTVGD